MVSEIPINFSYGLTIRNRSLNLSWRLLWHAGSRINAEVYQQGSAAVKRSVLNHVWGHERVVFIKASQTTKERKLVPERKIRTHSIEAAQRYLPQRNHVKNRPRQ